MAVRFYDRIDDARIRFSVIIARENGKLDTVKTFGYEDFKRRL